MTLPQHPSSVLPYRTIVLDFKEAVDCRHHLLDPFAIWTVLALYYRRSTWWMGRFCTTCITVQKHQIFSTVVEKKPWPRSHPSSNRTKHSDIPSSLLVTFQSSTFSCKCEMLSVVLVATKLPDCGRIISPRLFPWRTSTHLTLTSPSLGFMSPWLTEIFSLSLKNFSLRISTLWWSLAAHSILSFPLRRDPTDIRLLTFPAS